MSTFLAKLQDVYLREQSARYHHYLSAFVDCFSKGWIPATDAPEIQGYLSTLRAYIQDLGREVPNDLLLCYGLTRPGTQRGIVPPVEVLVENRGGFREKRQREALGAIKGMEDAFSVAALFGIDVRHEEPSDIRDVADGLSMNEPVNDEEKLRLYAGIRRQDVEAASEWAISLLKQGTSAAEDLAGDILGDLVSCQNLPLSETTLLELIQLQLFWPASIYRDGGDEIASALLQEIERTSDGPQINVMLLAFAWTRGKFALARFSEWMTTEPDWADALNVAPLGFTPFAGWTIDSNGHRRDLVSLQSHRLTVAQENAENKIRCMVPQSEACPSCGGALTKIFDFDSSSTDSSHIENERRSSFPTCLHCACYEVVFVRHHADGSEERLSPLSMADYPNDGYVFEPRVRTISGNSNSPYAGQEAFTLDDASSIGGFPSWLQDAEYPACVQCGELMPFIAQHDNAGIGEEGIYYGFYCWDCQVSAVHYQQT